MKSSVDMWTEAIEEAQRRLVIVERDRRRLQGAIRLMRRQMRDGVAWPGFDDARTPELAEAQDRRE